MSINIRIKELRNELGLSQAKFASVISISNGYIAGIELGNRKVNDRIVKLICSSFNVNEEWLRTGEKPMFLEKSNQLSEIALSSFKELKPEFQKYILKQIDQLLAIQQQEDGEDE